MTIPDSFGLTRADKAAFYPYCSKEVGEAKGFIRSISEEFGGSGFT
jgi:hypothetical protein